MMKYLLPAIFMTGAFSTHAQNVQLSGKISRTTTSQPIPFANVALYTAAGDSLVGGSATNPQGFYSLSVPAGNYRLRVSFMGYQSFADTLTLAASAQKNIALQPDAVMLGEVVVKGNRAVQGIDKTVYTFSSRQIKQAQTARELMLQVPTLRIDAQTNSLATVSGKSILILINGVKSTDKELALIAPDKIKRVDFYHVPPLRYLEEVDRVLDVETKDLDAGWAGNVYATGGGFYSMADLAASYMYGRHRFTLTAGSLMNPKRKIRNTEEGSYHYGVQTDDYAYNYHKESRDWSTQPNFSLTYSNSHLHHYLFQLKAALATYWTNSEANSTSHYSKNGQTDERIGLFTNKTRGLSPSVDLYYFKRLNKRSTLTLNAVGTLFDTRQDAYSLEQGADGYEEKLNLDVSRKSLIAEAIYAYSPGRKTTLNVGYRGTYGFLESRQTSVDTGRLDEHINTQKHYLYAELTGAWGTDWMYRLGVAGTQDVRVGADGFRHTTFTPVAMLGYRLTDHQSLRLHYQSNTTMPAAQQMSDNRILIMNHFYQKGNPQLQSSLQHQLSLRYSLSASWIAVDASLYGKINRRTLFRDFQAQADYIAQTTSNAHRDRSLGGLLELTFTPNNAVELGGSIEPVRQFFTPDAGASTYRYWSLPASIYLSLSYRAFSLDYLQRFGGSYLDGLYRQDYEKVSYLTLSYRNKQWLAGIQCNFPFIKDKYHIRTLPSTLVLNEATTHLKNKDHTFGLFLSWSFNTSRKLEARKTVQNAEEDKGTFEIR
ncbi:MAG: TonB-dependent receptor [Prevotellaceae bacterium]|jgi:hypothetical protein|nr:TonB-dependent receptor [Prevotellaceae bacterium]